MPPAEDPPAAPIHVNQSGYHTNSSKLAIVTDANARRADLIDAGGNAVFSATLSPASHWAPANETVSVFEFTSINTPGTYRVRSENGDESPPFEIGNSVVRDLGLIALKSFYFTRSGTELPEAYAGQWARPAGHPDTIVSVHASAAGPQRVAGDLISSPGGWYDAGDYNKYVVNASFATYMLLVPYNACPTCFADMDIDIPESGNGQADILDEARFNLDWLLTMQDPADGGVYHKLTSRNFSAFIMPDADDAQRFVVQKSTAATLDFAAVTAFAARVFATTDPNYSATLGNAAQRAWVWAQQNPQTSYMQPGDISTGTYASPADNLVDEWGWARVELYLLTRDAEFLSDWTASNQAAGVPSWSHVITLAWLSLARDPTAPIDLRAAAETHIRRTADRLTQGARDGYRVSMNAYDRGGIEGQSGADFTWGSNGVAATHSVVLSHAYALTSNAEYHVAGVSAIDYLFGRNPLGMSYVTGVGNLSPRFIHHRPSGADGIADPVPGLLAGGPNPAQQDRGDCSVPYASNLPALSYLDDVCSYASNENAINWNASLVAALFLADQNL